MYQIIFNEISAAEISELPTVEQMELLNEFKVSPEDLEDLSADDKFGAFERAGRKIYRYRARDRRIYFSVEEGSVVVHRVLHANTFKDLLYRSDLPTSEDEAVSKSKYFWELIEEGEKARRT